MDNKTICFIGAGKMATAIMKGLLTSKTFDKKHVIAVEVNEVAANIARENFGIAVYSNPNEAISKADIILIATKPFVVPELLDSIKKSITDSKLIISIAAGITFEKIERVLGADKRVVRVMPNTPALVLEGMSGVCKGAYASEDDAEFVMELLSNIGKCIEVSEDQIDIVTAISGSG